MRILGSILTPLIVAVGGFTLTALLTFAAIRTAAERHRSQLSHSAELLSQSIQSRVRVYETLLRATAAKISDQTPTAESFGEYVAELDMGSEYPGIQGIGFAVRSTSEITSVQNRSSGSPVPVHPKIESLGFPIAMIEPLDRRNLSALGFDMYSEPTRRRAMDKARETKKPTSTTRVTLVQEIDPVKQPGFLIYYPVFSKSDPDEIIGYVYSPFRGYDLFSGMLGNAQRNFGFRVYASNTIEPESLLYQSASFESESAERLARRSITIAQTDWTITAINNAEPSLLAEVAGIGAAGSAITLLLSGLLWHVEKRRSIAHRHILELKEQQELTHEGEQRKLAILQASLDCIIAVDADSRVVEFNQAAEQTFGYTREYALGKPLDELIIPPDLRKRHLEGMARHLATGESHILGHRVELSAMRRDGSIFPAELAINRIEVRGKPMFTAYLRDITARKQAETEIKKLNEGLEQKVAERTQELERTNKELETFSYSVSHDLRAPARRISAFGELLKQHISANDHEALKYSDIICRSALRMGRLVDDLLEFSRAGRKPLDNKLVSMNALVRNVLETFAENEQAKKIKWSITDLPDVTGDASLLMQAWSNLISNAVKYTQGKPEPKVSISAATNGSMIEFFVADNGVGFNPAYMGKLFKPFERLHSDKEFEGTGIGLAITARIIERHGGLISAQSEVGAGSTFVFALPASKPA